MKIYRNLLRLLGIYFLNDIKNNNNILYHNIDFKLNKTFLIVLKAPCLVIRIVPLIVMLRSNVTKHLRIEGYMKILHSAQDDIAEGCSITNRVL